MQATSHFVITYNVCGVIVAKYKIHCQEPWFSLLMSGKKPVEGRKNSSFYRKIKAGDEIIFFVDNRSFKALVTGVNQYAGVKEYLTVETLERALPGVSNLDEGLRVYHAWNTPEEISRDGFLGIQIKVIGD